MALVAIEMVFVYVIHFTETPHKKSRLLLCWASYIKLFSLAKGVRCA